MYFFLYLIVLAMIFQRGFSVHPGDPFPVDRIKSRLLTSEDLINANEIESPNDRGFGPISDSLTDPFDSANDIDEFMDYAVSTSTKTTQTAQFHKNDFGRRLSTGKSPLLTTKSITTITTTTTTTTTTTVTTTTSQPYDNMIDKSTTLLRETSTALPVKSFSQKEIGRWRYIDPKTKEARYWYQLEGGRMGAGWKFDRFIFQAYNNSATDTEPVYAFHSEIRAAWTNTIQMDPRPPIIGDDQWVSDGLLFYAYKTPMNSTELQPVSRYWNKLKSGATDATETRVTYLTIKTQDEDIDSRLEWSFDKVLFYVLPIGY
ncbi:unnamed protein product [Rotaria socialis]|uniref:Uncharacterized protein n=1 Tax=Rotaria socialis TaxID=392032 RepID=A0A818EE95_9BILA|nr:unnamed protein product [Rotaria socialis]CAF4430004.1 unnamed protein product [Rotaria socialis]